jgi:uncharacterized membrane protein
MSQSHIQEQIELIAKHEQDFLSQRTRGERLIDAIAAFIGSLTFVAAHLAIFAAWIVVNLLPNALHFDPKPFGLLQTCVAMEAILAASFILMRQTRIGRRSDERDHLMLQILLLTEKELTALLGMDRQIATEMGLSRVANTQDVRDLSQHTSIDEVAQTIKDTLPG